MRKMELVRKAVRIWAISWLALLTLLALTIAGAAEDNVTLEQINNNLSTVNRTMNYINETAPPAILSGWDIGKILAILAFIGLSGTIIIYLVIPKTSPRGTMSSSDAKCESVGRIVAIALVFLLLILAAILVKDSVITAGNEPTYSSIWAAIIILAIVFLLLIYLGFAVDGTLDQGEMRRAIAGTFVLGFTMLIFFLSRYEIANKEVVTAYLQMVGVIIGFYFGAKTALAGTGTGSSEGLAIEFVELSEDKKSVILTIRNKGDKQLVVDKVYLTGKGLIKPFETSVSIEPKTSNKTSPLTLDEALESGVVIKIKVVGNTGLTDEMEHKVE